MTSSMTAAASRRSAHGPERSGRLFAVARHPRLHLRGALFASAALASATTAYGAALERAVPQVLRLLYEPGTYAEFGLSYVNQRQEGEGAVFPTPQGPVAVSGSTGDMFDPHTSVFGALKGDFKSNPRFSYLLTLDQPFAVATSYGQGSFPSPALSYKGTRSDLDTYQIAGVLAYDVLDRVKVFGGVRAQTMSGTADVPLVFDYSVETNRLWRYGWLVGASFDDPRTRIRVGLTYLSRIDYDFDATEESIVTGTTEYPLEVDTPQSATLDLRAGISERFPGVVFGSIRWVNWAGFTIEPRVYSQLAGQPLLEYEHDSWTYTVGVAAELNEQLSGSLSVSHEPSVGGVAATLGPYDGRTTGTALLSYDFGQMNLTGALTYGVLGDARNQLQTDFDDGSIFGAALRVGYEF